MNWPPDAGAWKGRTVFEHQNDHSFPARQRLIVASTVGSTVYAHAGTLNTNRVPVKL